MAKSETYGTPAIKVVELKAFFVEHSTVPQNEDESFVLRHQVSIIEGEPSPDQYNENKIEFTAVFSTQRLLRNIINMPTIHADGTYKLLWHDCPAIIVGTTDSMRQFHLVAFALCTSENAGAYEFCFKAIQDMVTQLYGANISGTIKNLVSDAAGAIKNGFLAVFPDTDIFTCWFHVMKSNKDKGEFKSEVNRALALKDLTDLHKAPNEQFFDLGADLLKKKWEKKAPKFVQQFEFWLRPKNRNWYLGAAFMVPKTNNALEAFNGRIKRDFTLHEKASISVFKVKIKNMLNVLSCEYRDNKKQIERDVKVKDGMWYKALDWARSKKLTITEETDNVKRYYIPDGKREKITNQEFHSYKTISFKSFDALTRIMYKIWVVSVPGDDFKNAKCTCPQFFEKYTCKHVIGLAIRLKKYDLPEHIIRVESYRHPGRPEKAGPALERR